MATVLSNNLRKERKKYNLTQKQAAKSLGIALHNLQAYEEGRAEPSVQTMLAIADFYSIKNISEFIGNPDYQSEQASKAPLSRIERAYNNLTGRSKEAVDVLLGLK